MVSSPTHCNNIKKLIKIYLSSYEFTNHEIINLKASLSIRREVSYFTLTCSCANWKHMNSQRHVVVPPSLRKVSNKSQSHLRCSGVFIANFEQLWNIAWCFHCSLWTSNCRLGSTKFIFLSKLIFSICFARLTLSALLLQSDNIANSDNINVK